MASPKAMATANEHLPEDIIVQILYRLPVKPLIRFSCVSKRWSSIISDPQFAKSHFKSASERKALSQRLLLSTPSQLESFDLQTPSFLDNSSVRKLTFPFKQPGRAVKILGSCNGMVFVAARDFYDSSYIWNPSTGLLLKLPNPSFASNGVTSFSGFHCGFGYVSATDDYKVLAGHFGRFPVEMYSSKANSWKRIESQPPFSSEGHFTQPKGTFSNEALHWLVDPNTEDNTEDKPTIIALDLVKEKFWEMSLPLLKEYEDFFSEIGVVSGGCLCVASSCVFSFGAIIQLWVMMDYDVCESWTKLVKLVDYQLYPPFVYWERSIVMFSYDMEKQSKALVKFDHKAEEKLDKVAVCSGRFRLEVGDVDMIEYDESLLWLHDYQGAQNPTQAQKKKK